MDLTKRKLRELIKEELQTVLEQDEDPEIGFENLPPGWDSQSVNKFVRSLTGVTKDDPEGLFTKCVEKLKDEEGIDNPEKMCAAIKEEYLGTEDWREGPSGD